MKSGINYDECPHGADDPIHCADCRRRRYFDRPEREYDPNDDDD